jgi:hypothetical protein
MAMRFVLVIGVMSFFADFTYEGARSERYGREYRDRIRRIGRLWLSPGVGTVG